MNGSDAFRELPSAAKHAEIIPLRSPVLSLSSSSDAAGPALSDHGVGGEVAHRRLMLSAIRRWRFRAASRAVSQRLARRDPPDRGAQIVVQARPVPACATTSSNVLLSPSSSLRTTLSAKRSKAFRAAIERARDVAHAAEEPHRAARNAAQRRVEVRQTAAAAQRNSAVAQRSASVRRQRPWAGRPDQESLGQLCEPWEPPPPPQQQQQVGSAGVSATERRPRSTFEHKAQRTWRSSGRCPASAPRASEHRSSLSGAAAWADAQRAGRSGASVTGSPPASPGHGTASDVQERQKATSPTSSPARMPQGRGRGPAGGAAAHAAAVDVDPEQLDVDPDLLEVGYQIARVRAALTARSAPDTTPSLCAQRRDEAARRSWASAEVETSRRAAGVAVSRTMAQASSDPPDTATAPSGVTNGSEALLGHGAERRDAHAGMMSSRTVDIGRLGNRSPKLCRTLRTLDGNMAVLRLRRCAAEGTAAQEHSAVGNSHGEAAGKFERRNVDSELRQAQHKRSGMAVHAAVEAAAGGSSGAPPRAEGAGAPPLESGRVGAAFAKARAAELKAETETTREVFSYLAGSAGAARELYAAAGLGGEDHRTLGREEVTPGERAIAGANAAAAAAQAAAAEARMQIAEVVHSQLRRVMDCWRCCVLRRRWARQARHATRLRFVSDGTKQSLVQLRRTRSFDIPRARHRLPHQRSPPAMSSGISAPQAPHGLGRQGQLTALQLQSQVGEPKTPRPREPASWDAVLLACATLGRPDKLPMQNWVVSPAAAARLARNAGV